jgi:FkbM family methyltransferase
MKLWARDILAAMLRSLPAIKGKGSLGALFDKVVGAPRGDAAIRTGRMHDGSILRLDTRNIAEKWAYWSGDYDHRMIRLLSSICREKAVVLDIGANVGLWTVPLGRRLRELGGQLYAFEPVPRNFAVLQEQIRNNRLEATVTPVAVALGDRSGIVTLAIMESNAETLTGNAKVVDSGETGRTCTAPLMTLDNWGDINGIASCQIIKMDVEGGELKVLRGGLEFIRRHRPIIYGEFNSYWLQADDVSICDVANFIFPLEYQMYVETGGLHFSRVKDPHPGLEDVLLLPSETPVEIRKRLDIRE